MTDKLPRERDLLDELAEWVPVIHDILEQTERRQASHWLAIRQSDVARWEARGKTQRRLCSEIGGCADIRCRRRRYCRKLKWIAARERAARSHLTVAQAEYQACQPQREPATARKKKGRTDVRP